MADRAALITGGSSGIGLAIARALGREGYGLTVSARRPEKLEEAVKGLVDEGFDAHAVPANMTAEEDIVALRDAHRERYGRLDVLVNNAGVGIGAPIGELSAKHLDVQLATNLRAIPLFYRESLAMLAAAGAEHRNALVVNTASIAGKQGQPWLSIYSATKFGVVGFTQAMNKELGELGIKSTALCPGYVDTPMTDFVKGQVPPEDMIHTSDVVAAVEMLLSLTPGCVIPEVVFERPPNGSRSAGESA